MLEENFTKSSILNEIYTICLLDDMYTLIEGFNEIIRIKLANSTFIKVTPEELGLDSRSSSFIWVDRERNSCVVIHKSNRSLFDYYGGGEYVDSRHVAEMGDYIFYSSEDERVKGWIDRLGLSLLD